MVGNQWDLFPAIRDWREEREVRGCAVGSLQAQGVLEDFLEKACKHGLGSDGWEALAGLQRAWWLRGGTAPRLSPHSGCPRGWVFGGGGGHGGSGSSLSPPTPQLPVSRGGGTRATPSGKEQGPVRSGTGERKTSYAQCIWGRLGVGGTVEPLSPAAGNLAEEPGLGLAGLSQAGPL